MKQDISHMLEKAAITGITTAAASVALLGTGNYYRFPGGGRSIPLPLLTGALGVANSFVTDGLHRALNEVVPLGKKTSDRTALAINAAVSGVSFYALLNVVGTQVAEQYNFINAILTGAGAELAGSAIYEYLTNNLYI